MTQPDTATSTQDQNGGPTGAPGGDEAPGAGVEGGIGSVLYKLALAGVGALILAQEEIEAAWKRARGDRPEGAEGVDGADGADPAAQTVDNSGRADGNEEQASPSDDASGAPDGSRVWLQIDAAIGRMLSTLPIPSRDEVEEVKNKLDALAARIEARSRR